MPSKSCSGVLLLYDVATRLLKHGVVSFGLRYHYGILFYLYGRAVEVTTDFGCFCEVPPSLGPSAFTRLSLTRLPIKNNGRALLPSCEHAA